MTSRRTPDNFADAARAAYVRLTAGPLDDVDDNALQRYLPALQARIDNPHATLAQLAATMDPPLGLSTFRDRVYRAIQVAGVDVEPSGKDPKDRPAQFAVDARAAYQRLTRHRPANMADKIHTRYLAVLHRQMNNPQASAAQLAESMDPPMNAKAFNELLRRAITASQRDDLHPTQVPLPALEPAVNAPATTPHTYRSPSQLADAAQEAHARLAQRRPATITDNVYQRYLAVLQVRMNNRRQTNVALAATMTPPMSTDNFTTLFARAVRASIRTETPGPRAARQATDSAEALAVLQAHRPDHITATRHQQLLAVLAVRIDNPAMTYRQLGAQLDPPLTHGGFYAALRHAHPLAGVDYTFTPRARRATHPQRDSAA